VFLKPFCSRPKIVNLKDLANKRVPVTYLASHLSHQVHLIIFGIQEPTEGSRESKFGRDPGSQNPCPDETMEKTPITVAHKGNTSELCQITSLNIDRAPGYIDKEFS
jgi:hypothetical protein